MDESAMGENKNGRIIGEWVHKQYNKALNISNLHLYWFGSVQKFSTACFLASLQPNICGAIKYSGYSTEKYRIPISNLPFKLLIMPAILIKDFRAVTNTVSPT